jgi:GntR family transcriptional repressor for pyruvate dehydrogenase complex
MSKFLTPVVRTTLREEVCSRLTAHLVNGDWKAGDRLPAERELCELLGVGRASLREALKALELMGMIESRVGEGTFVRQRSEFMASPLLWSVAGSDESQLKELIEARLLVEGELARLAAKRASRAELRNIEALLNRMRDSITASESFMEADLNFHLAVAQAAHNRPLLNGVQVLRNLMRQWIEQSLHAPGTTELALRQHEAIFQAIAEKNGENARLAMQRHLEDMGKMLLTMRRRAD